MSDLEGLVRTLMKKGLDNGTILDVLVKEYQFYKPIPEAEAYSMAKAIMTEVLNSQRLPVNPFLKRVLQVPLAGVTMGEQGVGCRGQGDFQVHELISVLSETNIKPVLSPKSLDDCGAIQLEDPGKMVYIVSKMEGMHSRLSDFPFFAGFHVTRAALRDVYVKGATPISITVDIHLADDADVGKLFDFMAGVSAVAELTSVPITAGSTLRIGGDMVIGTRITGGIGAIGVSKRILPRKNIELGDDILMSEGAGGGTIVTTALYGGMPDVAIETMNIQFLKAACAVIESSLLEEIHCCTDVTNGGLRGDLHEISKECQTGMRIDEDIVKDLVNVEVLRMLVGLGIDFLGVSLDALLIFCPKNVSGKVIEKIEKVGVKIRKIGEVLPKEQGIKSRKESGELSLIPHFRESAYTGIKKVIGEDIQKSEQDILTGKINRSFESALKKKNFVINWMKQEGKNK